MWDQFGPEYDFTPFDGKTRTYLIASSGRTGSHYLAHMLFQTMQLGSPFEYLKPTHLNRWKNLLEKTDNTGVFTELMLRRTSPSGWFGLKAHWPQFAPVASNSEFMEFMNIQKYIRISRQDIVAQAVSFVIARQTKAWISFHSAVNTATYDYSEITCAIEDLRTQESNWDRFLSSVNADIIEVEYESLIDSPEQTLLYICEAFKLDVSHLPLDPGIGPQKQATELNAVWKDRYLNESSRF